MTSSLKSFQRNLAQCSKYTRIVVSAIASLILAFALGGVWWYEIVDFKFADPNNNGEITSIHIHGGLFRTCAPATYYDANGTIQLSGGDDCYSLEDVAGTPITRSMSIGRGYISAGLVLATIIAYADWRTQNSVFITEIYFVVFGLILAAFNQSLTAVVATGILVCNCVDELGPDGWLSMASLALYSFCFIFSKKNTTADRPKQLYWLYMILQIASFICGLLLIEVDFFDTTQYFNPFIYHEYTNPPTTTTTTTTTTTRPTRTTKPRPFDPVDMIEPKPIGEIMSKITPNSFIDLPVLNKEVRCAKKFNLWTYCDGYCDRSGEVTTWECVPFAEYPYAQIMWKSPTPTGITLNRIWLVSLILMLTVSLFFIRERNTQLRIGFVANGVFAFALLTNSYVYNLMESQAVIENDFASFYEVNAHNSGTV